MGAHQSKEFDHNKQSGLFIRTDKPFYFSGEEVQGNIYLNVEGGSFPSSTIYLKVKGSEKAKWSEKRTVWETITGTNPPQRKSKQIVDHYDNKNEFYQHRIPLYLQLRDNPIRLIQISIQIPIEGEFTRIILIHFLLRSGMQHKIQCKS